MNLCLRERSQNVSAQPFFHCLWWIFLIIIALCWSESILLGLNTQNSITIISKQEMPSYQAEVDLFVDQRVRYGLNNTNIAIHNHFYQQLSMDLLTRIFSGTSFFFHGDSVIHRYSQYIATLLHYASSNNTNITQKCGLNLDDMNILEKTPKQKHCIEGIWKLYGLPTHVGPKPFFRQLIKQNNFQLSSAFVFAKDMVRSLSLLQNEEWYDYKNNRYMKASDMFAADIIVSNLAAHHLLHLLPARPLEDKQMDVLINLEGYYDRLIDIALNNNKTQCVLIEGVNPHCNIYWDSWTAVAKEYENYQLHHNASLEFDKLVFDCLQLGQLNESYNYVHKTYGDYELVLNGMDLCLRYTLNQQGTLNLSKRIRIYVSQKQKELHIMNSHLRLIFFDNNKLYSDHCDYWEGAMHFTRLHPYRLVGPPALMNIIEQHCF
eukprot:583866_1